jgi:hypothetical protein
MSHRTAPPLPFTSPAWLTPSRVALAAIAAFAAAAALPSVLWIRPAREEIGRDPAGALVVVLSTILLSLVLARRALRAESVENAALWSILGAVPLGAINAGICLGGIELLVRGDPGGAALGSLLGFLVGGFVGGPIGLTYGVAFAVVIGSAVRACLSPSHDGPDRVLATSGVWLALSGVVISYFISVLEDEIGREVQTKIPPSLLIVMGALAAGAALIRLALRKKWLARVKEGRVPAFRIDMPPEDEAIEARRGLLPIVRPKRPNPEGILYFLGGIQGSPYRETLLDTPVALVEVPTRPRATSSRAAQDPDHASAEPAPWRSTAAEQVRSVGGSLLLIAAKTAGMAIIILLVAAVCAAPFIACAVTWSGFGNIQ